MGDHFVVCALTEVFCEGERLLILIQVQDNSSGCYHLLDGEVLPSLA